MKNRAQYPNFPLAECAKGALPYVEAGCHFYQKFTCIKCGSRQTVANWDQFYTLGHCEECDHITDIETTGCNYMLIGQPEVIVRVRAETALIPHIIRALNFANGLPCPIAGEWVLSFDFESDNGRGNGLFTNNPRQALTFDSKYEAHKFWNTQSVTRPLRDDGQPNRPLTSTTCVIEQRETAIKDWKGR
jgi:hypothetical protein